jgi:ABC-2 type transport system permease protein
MNKLFMLLKIQLNAQYGISNALYMAKNDKKSFWKGLGLGVVILLAFGSLIGLYSAYIFSVYKGAVAIGSPQIVITLGAVSSGMIILFFGLFYILSSLFLAKDNEFLISLPVKQETIFMSKFLMVLLAEYPFAFAMMLPPVIIYGVGSGRDMLYYLTALFGILLFPLFPLVVSAFFSLLMMNIVSYSKHRDLIVLIGSSLLIIGFIGGEFYLTSRIPEDKQQFLMLLLQTSNGIVDFMGRVFPPSVWLTKALSMSGFDAILNFFYLLTASLLSSLLVYFLSAFIYQRGAAAQLESGLKQGKAKLTYKSASPLWVFFKLEWKLLLRTPIYAINSLIMIFVAPLLLLMPLFGGNLAADPELKVIFDAVRDAKSEGSVLLIVAAFITMMTLINPAISSTFSREGRCFWMLKNVPVDTKLQVYGKYWAGYSISFLGALLAVVAAFVSFGLPLNMCLFIMVLCSVALIPVCVIGILIDLMRPKLVWNNAQEAIKQNANVMIAMLAGFVLMLLYCVSGYIILKVVSGLFMVFVLMFTELLILSVVSFIILSKVSENAYQKVEP